MKLTIPYSIQRTSRVVEKGARNANQPSEAVPEPSETTEGEEYRSLQTRVQA